MFMQWLTKLKNHINYFHYLLTNFNIIAMVGDYNGGVQFINAVKESSLFKSSNIKINILETEFDDLENYHKSLDQQKMNEEGVPCI